MSLMGSTILKRILIFPPSSRDHPNTEKLPDAQGLSSIQDLPNKDSNWMIRSIRCKFRVSARMLSGEETTEVALVSFLSAATNNNRGGSFLYDFEVILELCTLVTGDLSEPIQRRCW